MRFTIKREEFLKGLNIASRAVTSKNGALPILTNLKIELNEEGLYITGSNNDLTIKTRIPFKKGENEIIRNYKEGATLINAKIINDALRKMKSNEITMEIFDTTIAAVSDANTEYKFNSIDAKEYLDLDLEENGEKIELSKNDFSLLVAQTAFAASTKDQRPLLTAVNLSAHDGYLIAVATDGSRLAKKTFKINEGIEFKANVPAKMLVEIDHLLEGISSLNISISDKKALFNFEETIVATRLIAGKYPDITNTIPRDIKYTLQVNLKDMFTAIDNASVISAYNENVIKLSMSENSLTVSARSPLQGSGELKVEMFKFIGNPLNVFINSIFALDSLKALNSEDVTFCFVGPIQPFIVKNEKDDSIIQIITPMNLRA